MGVKDRIIVWMAMRYDRLPFFLAGIVDSRFCIGLLTGKKQAYTMPKRILFKRLARPRLDKDGNYLPGGFTLSVGTRYKVTQMLSRGEGMELDALCLYYGIRRWMLMLSRVWKVDALVKYMGMDLAYREKRMAKLAMPLTERQKKAGYGQKDFGFFASIDHVARRNHLRYGEVESLSDDTMYVILAMDAEEARVRRNEHQLMIEEQNMRQSRRR